MAKSYNHYFSPPFFFSRFNCCLFRFITFISCNSTLCRHLIEKKKSFIKYGDGNFIETTKRIILHNTWRIIRSSSENTFFHLIQRRSTTVHARRRQSAYLFKTVSVTALSFYTDEIQFTILSSGVLRFFFFFFNYPNGITLYRHKLLNTNVAIMFIFFTIMKNKYWSFLFAIGLPSRRTCKYDQWIPRGYRSLVQHYKTLSVV